MKLMLIQAEVPAGHKHAAEQMLRPPLACIANQALAEVAVGAKTLCGRPIARSVSW